jgi:hypothetical protein
LPGIVILLVKSWRDGGLKKACQPHIGGSLRLAALHADHARRSPMSIKCANKALIALCVTLAITLVLMVYA